MAELIDMEKVAGRYQSKHDLMQDIPQRKNEKVDVRDHFGDDDAPGTKGAKLGTPNSSAKSKSQGNTVNHKVENNFSNDNSDDVEIQTKAITSQSQTLDAQTGLMKDQSHKLDNLNVTMEKLYDLLYREHTKPEPKYQQQATSPFPVKQVAGAPDSNGQSNSFADLASDVMDMFGGKDKKGKGKGKKGGKVPKIQTTGGGMMGKAGKLWNSAKSMGGSLLGMGAGAAEGGWGSRVMSGAKGMFTGGGGGGWRGKLLKGGLAAGAAAVGYKGLESLGGLGAVSAMFESGKGGVGTISTGKGDNGGVSYGAHQLSSKSGTMAKFLRSEQGAKYADQFAGLQPGSAEFNAKYKEVVGNDSKGFEEAQAGFMKATHYDPAANKLAQDTGLDVSKRSRALQEMVYSTSTQYGGGSSVMSKALAGKDTASMSDEDIISAVQDYKRDNVGNNFKSSSAEVQRSVAQRAENEKKTLQKILEDEKKNPQGVMKGEDKKADGKTAADVAQGKTDPGSLLNAGEKPKGNEPIGIMPMKPQDIKADSANGSDVMEDGVGADGIEVEQAGLSTVDKAGLGLAGLGVAKKGAEVVGTKAATGVAEGVAAGTGRSLLRTVGGGVVNVGLSGLEAAEVINDDTMAKQQKQKSLVGIGGGMAGAAAGAEGGAALGAAIGLPFGGVGAIPGAAIGGFIGGTAGYFGGRAIAENGMDAALGTPEERQAKAAQGMYINSPMLQGEHSTLPGAPVALPSVKDLMTVPSKAPTEIATTKPVEAPIAGETPIATPGQTVTAETAAATLQPSANSLVDTETKPVADDMAVLKATTVPVAPNAPSFHKAAQAVAAKDSAPEAKVQTPTPTSSPTFDNDMDVLKATTIPVAPGAPSFAKAAQAVESGSSESTDKLAQAAQSLADSAAKLAAGAGQQPQDGTKGNQPGGAAPGSPGMPSAAPAGMSALDAKPLISSIAATMNPFSPASPSFYNSEPAISQRPSMATPVASAPAPAVAQAAAPEAANRQPFDTVQNVRMAVDQPSAQPAPAGPAGGGGGGKGGDAKGSDKPTLDEIPALISDFGLVFVNTGFL
jgi:hypothetical protein